MAKLIFLAISIFIVVRLYLIEGEGDEAALGGLAVVVSLALMIRFSDFWANTILRIGFMQSKASDYKSAQNSAPALVFLAWVFLIILFILVALK